MARNPLYPDALQPMEMQGNDLIGYKPTLADGWDYNAKAYGDWVAQQRADLVARGLADPQTGWPTQAGYLDAAKQVGQALLLGTTAPADGKMLYQHMGTAADLNWAMRNGYPLNATSQAAKAELEASMEPTDKDQFLFRGVSAGPFSHVHAKYDDIVPEDGFFSTSTNAATAKTFAGGPEPTLLRVFVPKGTLTARVGQAENEHVLPPGSKFRVSDVRPPNGNQPGRVDLSLHDPAAETAASDQ